LLSFLNGFHLHQKFKKLTLFILIILGHKKPKESKLTTVVPNTDLQLNVPNESIRGNMSEKQNSIPSQQKRYFLFSSPHNLNIYNSKQLSK